MISIRARVLLPVTALVVLGSVLISVLAFRDAHHEVEEIYDAQLAQGARLLQGVLEQREPGELDWARLYKAFDRAMSRVGEAGIAHPYETRLTFQVWSTSGELLARSAGAPRLAGPPARVGLHDFFENGNEWCGFLLDDPEQGLLIWVGERDDIRQDLIQRIVRHTLWPTLVGVPLMALVIWAMIGWGLKPLQGMARIIRSRHADSFEPLELDPLPPELAPMQAALNRQLILLKGLLERERRFIADAAHELRTPLAILRIHARNAQQADSVEERSEALVFLQQGVQRATRIASQLLTMARLEPDTGEAEQQVVDLEALVREELAEFAPLAIQRRVELALAAEGDCRVIGEPDSVAIALQNLLANALNFAPEGSEISVVLQASDEGRVRLQVLDSGPGVEEAELGRLFDRFYSQGTSDGAGLGLAIVERVMRRIGGEVRLGNREQGGFRAELCLRTAPAGRGPAGRRAELAAEA